MDALTTGHGQGDKLEPSDILRACRRMKVAVRQQINPERIDVYVTTSRIANRLREYLQQGSPTTEPISLMTVYGVPFEVYETEQECRTRCIVLMAEGKRAGLITE